jgi:uncharacterized membrane protein
MKLREIDKSRYRKHLKIVFAGIVVIMVVVSLATSVLLIQFFSTPEASHFYHNLAGVIIAAVITLFGLKSLRTHPFMDEVVYVWDLKYQLNRIYRKQHKIEPLIEENHVNAMIIMNYMYKGSQQLYKLDDNTITIDALIAKSLALDTRIQEANLTVSTDDYDPSMLAEF